MDLNQEQWNKLEQEFLSILKGFFDDIHRDIYLLRKTEKKSFKSQLCLTFVLADTMSRVHRIFQGYRDQDIDKNNEERFRKWIDDFVLNDKNEKYKKHRGQIAPNSKSLWEIRNSFIHFYCLPDPEKSYAVFSFGLDNDFNKKIISGLRKASEKEVYSVDGYHLMDAILEGFTIQLLGLRDMILNNPKSYIDHVKYAYNIFRQQSTKMIDIEEMRKVIYVKK